MNDCCEVQSSQFVDSTPPGGHGVCHAQPVAEVAGAGTEAQNAVLATQTMSETLAALGRQLEAQSAEMRAMREAFAKLQQEH